MLSLLWSLVVWAAHFLFAFIIGWFGHDIAKQTGEAKHFTVATATSIVYIIVAFCMAFIIKSNLLFLAVSFGLFCAFFIVVAVALPPYEKNKDRH
ncbi:MAG: hypothetical protein IJR63_12025 [Synergistaceae bacterium]|nr:hypothetical protein [Synergistaceae bacterium]